MWGKGKVPIWREGKSVKIWKENHLEKLQEVMLKSDCIISVLQSIQKERFFKNKNGVLVIYGSENSWPSSSKWHISFNHFFLLFSDSVASQIN